GRSRVAGRGISPMRLSCLVPPDTLNARIALEVKRQLQTVGVDLVVEEASQDSISKALTSGEYEAALVEGISGPTLFRTYQFWHSQGSVAPGSVGNPLIDASLDGLRHAPSEPEYRRAVTGVQHAFMDDPPAIFL